MFRCPHTILVKEFQEAILKSQKQISIDCIDKLRINKDYMELHRQVTL